MPFSHPSRAICVAACSLPLVVADRAGAQTDSSFISKWQARASATQAEQPHWVTPLATTTPRLEQEFRYDLGSRTATPAGTNTVLYGNAKGLELIPLTPVELIIGVPGYTVHHSKTPNGFGDMPLTLKYRFISNNASHGDDILDAFLVVSVPTGGKANGAVHYVTTPTLAGGKGWGDVDIQATAGVNLPAGGASTTGHAIVYNVASQYHASRFLWPELELNGTTWRDGVNVGKNQEFLTPGVVFGRFPIHDRVGFTAGAGIQIAVSSYHQYDHAWILSLRLPF